MSFLFAQDFTTDKDLLERVQENRRHINKNSEEEFLKAKLIEAEARKVSEREVELLAIVNQCIYYKAKVDFENLKMTAISLFNKAQTYKMTDFQAIGKYYVFEAYLFNGLSEKAFEQLEEGMKFVNQANKEGVSSSGLRNNFHIAYSNYYQQKNDFKNQLKYIKLSGEEVSNMPEGERKHELMHLYYSNLAQVYNEMNQLDSAQYYSHLSNSIDQGYNTEHAKFMNYLILGKAAMQNKEYNKAISYFVKAEKIEGSRNHINLLDLYENMIETYQKLNLTESAQLYQYKKDSLRLNISENQNKFLRNLLDGINAKTYKIYLFFIIILLVLLTAFIFIGIRRKNLLLAHEKLSEQYLERNQNIGDDHLRLIDLVKENNPAFLTYFEEVHPGFIQKLEKVNPKITHSDAEFCALLKLRLPTKEIAKYRFIAPKTVQNKRYLIRKKLNIPKTVDTYEWFDAF